MSKTKGNVINPDEYITEYGIDVFRTYLMFFGNFKEGGDFRDKGIPGIKRFIEKLRRYCHENKFIAGKKFDKDILRLLNMKIKQVTEDIKKLDYNTAIAGIMELFNGLSMRKKHYKEAIRILLQLLSPFAPFITHELWERLGGNTMISAIPWPVYNREYIQRDIITCVIQINSKIRDRLELPVNMSQHEVKEKALQSVKIQKYLKDTRIKKEIFIKNKLINFVVEPL